MNPIVRAGRSDEKNLVRFASDDVLADVQLNEDGRNRSTSYALQLASAEQAVNGRLVGVLASGDVIELGSLEVAPRSVGASRFAVALQKGARFTGVFLEIRSGAMLLRVAAPQLPAPRKGRAMFVGGSVAALGVVAVALGAVLTPFLPGTPLLAAPARAVAGELVTLPYETRGLGSARFSAMLDDRTPLGSGALDAARGEIAVVIPPNAARKRVEVVLQQSGPFGRAERSASFPVAAPQPRVTSATARVVVFSARRERGATGESVLASYLAVADGGTLSVSNTHGRIVASAPFSHHGTQRLMLPGAVASEPVLVRLAVALGNRRSTAAVDLPPALPLAAAPAAPAKTDAVGAEDLPESVAPADDHAAPAGSATNEAIAVIGRPIAGQPFTVQIRVPAAAMRLRLEDDAGAAIEDVAVPDGARRVTLLAPAGGARTYYLTCTYGRGNAQEVVVRSVRVRAP